jgi:DNA-binding CsgD family transcriptional regulator
MDGRDFAAPAPDEQLLAVHEVLDQFAKEHPLQAEVVKLRYFVGMTNEETAEALGVSVATVKKLLDVCSYVDFHRDQEFIAAHAAPQSIFPDDISLFTLAPQSRPLGGRVCGPELIVC